MMYPSNFRLLVCVATSWCTRNQTNNQKRTKWWQLEAKKMTNDDVKMFLMQTL